MADTFATMPYDITIKGLSLSSGGGGGGSSTLAGLTDVQITEPTDGQALVYDNASEKWINGTGAGYETTNAVYFPEQTVTLTPDEENIGNYKGVVTGTMPTEAGTYPITINGETYNSELLIETMGDITAYYFVIYLSDESGEVYITCPADIMDPTSSDIGYMYSLYGTPPEPPTSVTLSCVVNDVIISNDFQTAVKNAGGGPGYEINKTYYFPEQTITLTENDSNPNLTLYEGVATVGDISFGEDDITCYASINGVEWEINYISANMRWVVSHLGQPMPMAVLVPGQAPNEWLYQQLTPAETVEFSVYYETVIPSDEFATAVDESLNIPNVVPVTFYVNPGDTNDGTESHPYSLYTDTTYTTRVQTNEITEAIGRVLISFSVVNGTAVYPVTMYLNSFGVKVAVVMDNGNGLEYVYAAPFNK